MFDQTKWKELAGETLRKVRSMANRFKEKEFPFTVYGAVGGLTLWPLVEAAQAGQLAPVLMTLGSVAGGVGGNLIATQIQRWADKAAGIDKQGVVRWVLDQSKNLEFQAALDDILAKVEAIENARLSEKDREWFTGALQHEMSKLGNLKRFEAVLIGSGAIAVGHKSKAVGEGGVLVEGGMRDSVIPTGDGSRIEVYRSDKERVSAGEALRIYREVVLEECRFLPMRGIDVGASDPASGQERMGLAEVYVGLNTRTPVSVKKGKKSKEEEAFRGERETRPMTALEAAAGNRRLVLLGDPGSGKTTFMNHLAFCLAGNALSPQGDWLSKIRGWPEKEADSVPIPVVLRDFAGRRARNDRKAEVNDLWKFIVERLEARNLDFAVDHVKEALERGEAVVLLDGLDEIPEERGRGFVRDAIATFWDRYKKARMIVTCRVVSYQDRNLLLEDFPSFELAPFDAEMIDAFIKAWYAELLRLGVMKSEEEAQGMFKRLQESVRRPDIRRLAPNPLLLTVMALVNTHRGKLPDARAMLYEEAVDILLWRWDQMKAGVERTQPRLTELLQSAGRADVDLKGALGRLAFEAHKEGGGRDGEALADIKEWQLQKGLAELHPKKSRDWAAQMINTIKLRAGLLIERDAGVYTFPHRTFQEFLAGVHLSSEADFPVESTGLAEQGAFWREVILLAVGRLVYLPGDLSRPLVLVSELCPKEAPGSDVDWRKVWLAGDVLLEVGVQRARDKALGRELMERVPECLAGLLQAGALTPVERTAAGNTLARLGDPRFDPEFWHLPKDVALGFVEIPAGPFSMGTIEEEIPHLLERFGGDKDWYKMETPRFKPRLETYYTSRYPVTAAQFNAFLVAGGYGEPRYWKEARDAGVWKEGKVKGFLDVEWRQGPYEFGEPFNLEDHPVVGVTWYEALAYCRWLTERLKARETLPLFMGAKLREEGWVVRLPTEAEWEKAARGTSGRVFPWGNEIDADSANWDETGIKATSTVGCFPKGVTSEHSVLDMAGNVWEWCLTKWHDSYRDYPYDNSPRGKESRVVRGGSFDYGARFLRCAYRYRLNPDFRDWYIGFRVVFAPEFSSVL